MNVELIRKLVKEKGVSIKKMEEDLKLGNGTVGKWATQSPRCDTISKVADYLSVSIDYLVYGEEKTNSANSFPNIQNRLILTKSEEALIKAYRKNPDVQEYVHRLLKIEDEIVEIKSKKNG